MGEQANTKLVRLGDCVKPRKEKAQPSQFPDLPYVGLEHIEAHSTKILGSAAASEMRSSANRFNQGDVLYSRLRPYLNKVWLADCDGLCSSEFIVLPGSEVIDAGFLRYRLNSADFVAFANGLNTGDRPRVDFDQISSFSILQFSLQRQRQIVAEIEKQFTRLEAGLQGLRRAQANLRRHRAAVLKVACEGKLVPNEVELAKAEGRTVETGAELLERILAERRKNSTGRGKYNEPAAPATCNLPSLPKGWAWATILQLRIFSLYGPRFSSDDYADEGYIVLRTTDINESGKVDTSKAPRLKLSRTDFEKYRVKKGDLLVTRTGSLGTLAVFDDEVEAIPGAYLIQFRLATETPTTRYLFYLLKSPIGQNYLTGKGAGVGRPNLNAPTIESMLIPLPPLAEQIRIVAEVERRLSIIDELEAIVAANLQRAARLRQSILQRAFAGELI
jgi:type I restriction enzyme S subunit